ncbi:MAG: protein crcB, partial [Actinobacteria bacterium 66_15]
MTGFLLVAVGGAAGASARYAVSLCTHAASGAFPWSTLGVNVAGSFLLGLLTAVLPEGVAGERLRLLVGVGALGGFTTFSTFSVEALALARGDQWLPAAGYVVGSVVS